MSEIHYVNDRADRSKTAVDERDRVHHQRLEAQAKTGHPHGKPAKEYTHRRSESWAI